MEIQLLDPNAGDAIARLPWVADGIIDAESLTLEHLSKISVIEVDLVRQLTTYAWLVDGVTENEQIALEKLLELSETNQSIARQTVAQSWFKDAITENERWVIYSLGRLAGASGTLAQRVAALPWVVDGITESEDKGLYYLQWVARSDAALAQQVLEFHWVGDGITGEEWWAISSLNGLAMDDTALAQRIADFPWVQDDMTKTEGRGISSLADIAATDAMLAQRIVALPWVQDDMTEAEWGALEALSVEEPETVAAWLDSVVDDEAIALMAVLGWAKTLGPHFSPDLALYNDLLDSYFVQNATVSLPMAGEVNLWAFQSEPFPQDEDLTSMLEDAVRATEKFMGLPFPATDVILAVPIISPERDQGVGASRHWGKLISTTRYEPEPIWRGGIYHEVAHYYFSYGFGPPWLYEGGADFMKWYTNEQAGLTSLEDQKPSAWEFGRVGLPQKRSPNHPPAERTAIPKSRSTVPVQLQSGIVLPAGPVRSVGRGGVVGSIEGASRQVN